MYSATTYIRIYRIVYAKGRSLVYATVRDDTGTVRVIIYTTRVHFRTCGVLIGIPIPGSVGRVLERGLRHRERGAAVRHRDDTASNQRHMASEPEVQRSVSWPRNCHVDHISSRYAFGRKLGEGANGAVYEAKQKYGDKLLVAVKVYRKAALSHAHLEDLRTEVALLRRLHHPHIVGFHEMLHDPMHAFLVLEHLGGACHPRAFARAPSSMSRASIQATRIPTQVVTSLTCSRRMVP